MADEFSISALFLRKAAIRLIDLVFLVYTNKKNRSKKWNGFFIYSKISGYAKTSFTLFAASSKVIAE